MDYLARLKQAHRVERAGEAVYATTARLTFRSDRRAKWLALADLEKQSKEAIALEIVNQGSAVPQRSVEVLGRLLGTLMAALPWRLTMRVLARVAQKAVPFWESLERDFSHRASDLLARLTAHERAQVEFAKRELRGDGQSSLDPVVALIGQ